MQVLYNRKLYKITFALILAFSLGDFFFNAPKRFEQLRYDWGNVQFKQKLGKVKVDSVSYDFLRIIPEKQQIYDILEPGATYRLSHGRHSGYYFRYSDVIVKNGKISFVGLFWINNIPDKGKMNFTILGQVELSLIQKGNKTVCMIGDSQLIYRDGKNLRKTIVEQNQNIVFVGDTQDLYGYPHCSKLLNNSDLTLKNLPKIQMSDYYVLFYGLHENGPIDQTIINTSIIVSQLQLRGKLLMVNLPDFPDNSKKEYALSYNHLLDSLASTNNIALINLFQETSGRTDFFQQDGLHLNKKGHDLLAGMILNALHNEKED